MRADKQTEFPLLHRKAYIHNLCLRIHQYDYLTG